MSRTAVIFSLLLILAATSYGQDGIIWSTIHGGSSSDGGRSVVSTSDGGLLFTGYTFSMGGGDSDLYLLKTDADGNELWSRAFGGPGREYGYAGLETSTGRYLATGFTTSSGNGLRDLYLVEVDSNGNLVSEQSFGGPDADVGRAICETENGTLAICGYTESFGLGETDIYLILIDPQGNVSEMTYGGAQGDFGMSIQPLSDGFVIGGGTGSYNTGNRDFYLVRLDPAGNELWHQSYGIPANYDIGYSVCLANDGGFVIAGHSDIHLSDLMGIDVYRTDENGNILWSRRIDQGIYYEYAKSVISTRDGGYVVCGAAKNTTTGKNNLFLIRLDTDGQEIWRKSIGEDGSEWGSAICEVPGGYVVAGHQIQGDGTPSDLLAMKITDIVPRIEAIPSSGHASLTVEFTDLSLGAPTSWRWDLDGDGSFDTVEQHPTWTYDEPGIYSIMAEVSDEWYSATVERHGYIRVFDGESSLEFDGRQSMATCQASATLAADDAVTVEAWIYPRSWGEVSGTGYGRIVDKSSYALGLHGEGSIYSNHSVIFILKNQSGPPHVASTPENTLALDGWQHVAATYSADDGQMHVYINGVDQTLTVNTPPDGLMRNHADVDLVIGNSSSQGYTFDGMIDELRIWDISRSNEQIIQSISDYLIGDEEGLVGYWSMNEAYGDEIIDGSGNENHGSLSDVGWWMGTPFEPTYSPFDESAIGVRPAEPALMSIYPNPFIRGATVHFHVPSETDIALTVYDLSGRSIRSIVNGIQHAGGHSVYWDGSDETGRPVSSGLYFLKLTSASSSATKPCIRMN